MINKQVFKLTEKGKADYERELEYYKNVLRPQNINAIAEARAQGDLSENADYSSARDEQVRIESKILELENILKNAIIIENDNSSLANVGKTVEVRIYEKGKSKKERKDTFQIVSSIEADPFSGKISEDCPIGRALIGRSVEDGVVTVVTETGKEVKVEIISVQ